MKKGLRRATLFRIQTAHQVAGAATDERATFFNCSSAALFKRGLDFRPLFFPDI